MESASIAVNMWENKQLLPGYPVEDHSPPLKLVSVPKGGDEDQI